jgi:hypothetical protein
MKKGRQNHWLKVSQREEEQLGTRPHLYEEGETESLAKYPTKRGGSVRDQVTVLRIHQESLAIRLAKRTRTIRD